MPLRGYSGRGMRRRDGRHRDVSWHVRLPRPQLAFSLEPILIREAVAPSARAPEFHGQNFDGLALVSSFHLPLRGYQYPCTPLCDWLRAGGCRHHSYRTVGERERDFVII